MRATAKKAPKRPRAKRGGRGRLAELVHVGGRVENGRIRLSRPIAWSDGQQVVVIPLPRSFTDNDSGAPTVEELEEDFKEFARRKGSLASINRSELD